MSSSRARRKRKRGTGALRAIRLPAPVVAGAITMLALSLLLLLSLRVLTIPTRNGTLAITAVTGSLTLEPLCGESVTWDLPAGRVGRRSVPPGEPGYETSPGAVTMVLAWGSRAGVVSSEPGVLRVTLERVEVTARRCPSAPSQPYRLILDGTPLPLDPIGFNYEARLEPPTAAVTVSLPLSGRVVLGQAVPEGADWRARSFPILLSGAIVRRVRPWLSQEVMTVGETERLDEGSVLDSHACADGGESGASGPECNTANPAPAVGFFRNLATGGLQVQVYAQGPATVQNYRGPQRHIEVPLSTALWESDTIKVVGAFLLLVFACLEQVIKLFEALRSRVLRWIVGTNPDKAANTEGPAWRSVSSGRNSAKRSEAEERSTAAEAYHQIELIEPGDHKKSGL